jgi:hypothetical protein
MRDLWIIDAKRRRTVGCPAYRTLLDGAGSQPDPAFEQIDIDASVPEINAAPPLDPTLAMLVLTKTEPFAGLPGFPTLNRPAPLVSSRPIPRVPVVSPACINGPLASPGERH